MMIRKATLQDIDAVHEIYERIHDAKQDIGWIKGVYPVKQTAVDAVKRNDLFVMEADHKIVGSAIINTQQVDAYAQGNWKYETNQVCVLHTLVISPLCYGHGYGSEFVAYYEKYAKEHGFHELRMDTNEKNKKARALYAKLGYEEIGMVPTVFNGIPNVNLIILEKHV